MGFICVRHSVAACRSINSGATGISPRVSVQSTALPCGNVAVYALSFVACSGPNQSNLTHAVREKPYKRERPEVGEQPKKEGEVVIRFIACHSPFSFVLLPYNSIHFHIPTSFSHVVFELISTRNTLNDGRRCHFSHFPQFPRFSR